jgi:membrane protein YdbS with pleckstrin-like domain
MAGEGKVIKPPIENVASGKIIKPAKAFRNKMWFTAIFSAVALWIILFGTLWVVLSLVSPAGQIWTTWWTIINLWYIAIALVILVPYFIIVPYYLRSIEYSVITEEGTTAREIFVKKGIINITRKHVPFRTITNISSRAGLFDRLFGIGSIEIETAGYSGTTQAAEEKLEGITFYEELRDFILRELRKFKDPYVTGTEIVHPIDEPVLRSDDSLEDEILLVLREIRDLLRREKE